ncbi:MAG: hypothetical protein ACJ71T_08090 [Actinomycetales bacterium]
MSFVPGDPYSADPALLVGTDAERRRPRWLVPVVASLAVAGLALSALSSWAIWQLPTGPAAAVSGVPSSRQPTSETAVEAAVRQILVRRGAAVLRHDKAGFLADLDPSRSNLRAQQTAIYDGLAKLDFARFSYRPNGSAFNPGGHGTGKAATTHIAGVLATYQLQGYDTRPVVEAMAVTFVQRDHRWWIASDRDVDDELPAAGHAEPWDDGQVGVAKGRHSLVIGQARDDATLQRVADAVDRAVTADLVFWPAGNGRTRWAGRVVVYVPTEQREFTSLFRGSKQTADGVVAVAIPVYDHMYFDAYGNGHPYGEVSGSRIIINPKYFRPSSSFFAVTLRHEVSHVAAQPITSPGTPSWLVEGLAEYVGWRQSDPSRTFFARGVDRRTAEQINARTFHLTLPSSSTFYVGSSATIASRYTAGFLVCAYIQHRYGESRLKTFATRMDAAKTPSKERAVLKSALQKTFGLSTTGLQNGVTAWMHGFTVRHR